MKEKIAIVCGGGGMKCAYSAGALFGLATVHNLKEPAILVGSSGSTGSLAYYAAGQYSSIKAIWADLISSKKLISFKRLNRIVDIDYLIDSIIKVQEPLNEEKVNQSKTKLFISATEYATGKTKYFQNLKENNLFESLRASKAIPFLFNRKVNIKDIEYVDGSIAAPTSTNVRKAISEGAENIVVISDMSKVSLSNKVFWKIYALFVSRDLRKAIKRYLKERFSVDDFKDTNIFSISPSKELATHSLDNKKENLEKMFNLGFEDAKNSQELKAFLDS